MKLRLIYGGSSEIDGSAEDYPTAPSGTSYPGGKLPDHKIMSELQQIHSRLFYSDVEIRINADINTA